MTGEHSRRRSETLGNLPTAPSSFVGRVGDIARVGELLARTRLLTLTGAGGCGKTRLAQQAAAVHAVHNAGGVWWVDLAALEDGGLLGDAVARAMRLPPEGRPAPDVIAEHVADTETLVVLDTCEHLVDDAAALTGALLRHSSGIRIMTTSRRPLGAEGETTWRVPSLAVPPVGCGVEQLRHADAANLLLERLGQALPEAVLLDDEAELVVQLCRRLDGIPLALELAAAQARVMSLTRIVGQLDDRFRLLRHGPRTVPARHRTLQACVQWSYELLSADERVLLHRLAVFPGSFPAEAVDAVAGFAPLSPESTVDVLTGLVEQSLAVFDVATDRYHLLDSIRAFARNHLRSAGQTERLADRHLDWSRDFVEAHAEAVARAEPEALATVERELPTLRAALDHATRADGGPSGLRLVVGLTFFWAQRGLGLEGAERAQRVLTAHQEGEGALRGRALAAAAYDAFYGGDFTTATALADRGLVTSTEARDPQGRARCRHVHGISAMLVDPGASRRMFAESVELARSCGDLWCETDALQLIGFSHLIQHRPALGLEALTASAAMAEAAGNRFQLAWNELAHYLVSAAAGQLEEAARAARRGAEAGRRIGDPAIELWGLAGQLTVALARGRHDDITAISDEAAPPGRPLPSIIEAFVAGLRRAARQGPQPVDAPTAITGLTELAELLRTTFVPHDGIRLELTVAAGWYASGHPDLAEDAARAGLEHARGLGSALVGPAQVLLAQTARRRGASTSAVRLAHDGLAEIADAGLVAEIPDALQTVAGASLDLGAPASAARLMGAVDALRDRFGLPDPLEVSALVDRAAARDALGPAFDVYWEEGRSLDLHAAVSYARRSRGERRRPSTGWGALTPTELDIARLAAQGLTNPDIGRALFIARGTVKTHLEHVYAKLGIHNRTQLAAAFVERHEE